MMSTFNFIEGPVIAHGGFGRVCSGVLNGEQVVSKRMLAEDESLNEDFNIELNNCLELAREPNTNVMLLKGFINASPIKLMIFEKAKTDLGRFHMELIQLNKTFTLKQFVSIFAHIINGLNYIYSKGYIHRDIKPENILLVDGIAKIGDLGLATLLDREGKAYEYAGTPYYMAPEIYQTHLRTQGYGIKADIYSLGLTLFDLLLIEREHRLYDELSGEKFPPRSDLIEVILAMTNDDPSNRPNLNDLMCKDIFNTLFWQHKRYYFVTYLNTRIF